MFLGRFVPAAVATGELPLLLPSKLNLGDVADGAAGFFSKSQYNYWVCSLSLLLLSFEAYDGSQCLCVNRDHQGYISEVTVWSRALNAQDVLAVMKGTSPPPHHATSRSLL